MTDSAANRDSTWHPRDFEAHMLVELLCLSRVTVLYGAKGVGKTTLLKTGVLPLLRSRAEERNLAQSDKPRIVVPFPGRHGGMIERGAEIAIIFDRWSNTPLAALQEQMLDMLPVGSPPMVTVMPSLTDILAAWNEALGVRFFVILDSFEQYLRAPFDHAGIAEFDDEFVRMVNEPLLPAHFLLSVRDDAEGLLNRYRERISGFGDAFLRLPDLHLKAPSLAPDAQTHRAAAAATPLETGEPVPILAARPELRRPARTPARISLAAILAGFAIGAGAGYFAVYGYQGISTWQTASSAKGVGPATAHTAGLSTVHVPPATRTDHLVPPPSSERTSAVDSSAPPPGSPTPIKRAKAASPTPKVASRIAPRQAVPIATAAIGWQTAMHRELMVCSEGNVFERIVCTEKVRWKHCAPNRWNAIPECEAGNIQVTRSD